MNSKKLLKIIRKIVKEEVKNTVNQVLAEAFVKNLNNNSRSVLKETVGDNRDLQSVLIPDNVNQKELEKKKQIEREKFRKEVIAKISGGNPLLESVFEDVDPTNKEERKLINSSVTSLEIEEDDDSDGVDISQFGY